MSKTMEIKGHTVIVDDEDYELLLKHKWNVQNFNGIPYVVRLAKLHCEIMQPPPGYQVDHKNSNRMDNRRCNLRICTASQNMHNKGPSKSGTSKYKGVSWDKYAKKWSVYINATGQQFLGYFKAEIEAAQAYDDAASTAYGEWAWLNREHFEEVENAVFC